MTTRTFTSLTISARCAIASARASGQAVSADGDTPAPVVVIDAGHGGSNLGAPGQRAGLFEKRVTLAVAHAVERRLSDAGLGVVMTRGRDEYVTLGERVRRANAAHARLFVSIHANARGASEAAMCASVQGKFWELHRSLFDTQTAWAPMLNPMPTFDSLAVAAKVDPTAWRKCMADHATRPIIDADQDRSSRVGVKSTPSFFIGDRALEGAYPADTFRVALDAALAKARSKD